MIGDGLLRQTETLAYVSQRLALHQQAQDLELPRSEGFAPERRAAPREI